jgi:hypothetical protein
LIRYSRNLKQGRHPVNVGYIGARQTWETAMDDEDPVRDIASAFSQRHRREEFPFEALMFIVVLIFARKDVWQILVSNAVEETVLEFPELGGFTIIEPDCCGGKRPLDCRAGLPGANIWAQNAYRAERTSIALRDSPQLRLLARGPRLYKATR